MRFSIIEQTQRVRRVEWCPGEERARQLKKRQKSVTSGTAPQPLCTFSLCRSKASNQVTNRASTETNSAAIPEIWLARLTISQMRSSGGLGASARLIAAMTKARA